MVNKNKKSSWQTLDEYENEKIKKKYGAQVSESEVKKLKDSMAKDSYTSRNEFKKGFYDQADKPPVTAETMYGTGTTKQLNEGMMSPDDSMLVEYKSHGGSVMARGNKIAKSRPTKLY
jgi:hypothetical protein